MTKREWEQRNHMLNALASLGFTMEESHKLRRISMCLHSWSERECGTDYGCIERDDETGKPFWLNSRTMSRYPIRDMEKGAINRLNNIMKNHPTLQPYIQGDPRGAALYILRPGDVPADGKAESYYTRGICVY